MTTTTEGFNANYKTLKRIAEELRQQEQSDEPNIDALLPMVEEATKAYKACKERLDAIETALLVIEKDNDIKTDEE